MKAFAFFPNLDQIDKNDVYVLVAAANLDFVILNTEEELLNCVKGCDPASSILLTETEQINVLEKISQEYSEMLIVILSKSKIEMSGSIFKRCPNIRSFVAISGPENYAADFLTLIRKYQNKEIFGIERYLHFGTPVSEANIYGSEDKITAISRIGKQVASLGTYLEINRFNIYERRVKELIDELVLNAVFNANPRMHDAVRSDQFSLEESERVTLRWAYDGTNFAVSVTDYFGSLQRETVLKYLTKTADLETISKRHSGGMGFQLAFDKVHKLIINVHANNKTEIICLMKFEKRLRDYDSKLKSFHYFSIK